MSSTASFVATASFATFVPPLTSPVKIPNPHRPQPVAFSAGPSSPLPLPQAQAGLNVSSDQCTLSLPAGPPPSSGYVHVLLPPNTAQQQESVHRVHLWPQHVTQSGLVPAPAMHAPYFPAPLEPLTNARPAQFLYYHQIESGDRDNPYIGWSTREAESHSSPPIIRRRTARACQPCRKRKSKCSGEQPCTRCQTRGLQCEYDDKLVVRGNAATTATPVKPARYRTSSGSSRSEHRHQPYAVVGPSTHPRSSRQLDVIGQPLKRNTADSLGFEHLQAALEVAIEMDRLSHRSASPLRNSSFVASDRILPFESGLEMSSMVQTFHCAWDTEGFREESAIDIERESDSQHNIALSPNCSDVSEKSSDESSSEEDSQSDLTLGTHDWSDGVPLSTSLSPSPLMLAYPPAPQPSPELSIVQESWPTLVSNVESEPDTTDIGQDKMLSTDSRFQSVRNLAMILDDVFSAGYMPSQANSYITPSSSAVTLDFDDYVDFSPNARHSSVVSMRRLATPLASAVKVKASQPNISHEDTLHSPRPPRYGLSASMGSIASLVLCSS
ncbi:hypothetical protein BC835DRAFT_1409969 [Cytidiella melzeri]|nr:hypothetical protein BC835DRAFT_1409969 [Cytidiella melzeri]